VADYSYLHCGHIRSVSNPDPGGSIFPPNRDPDQRFRLWQDPGKKYLSKRKETIVPSFITPYV